MSDLKLNAKRTLEKHVQMLIPYVLNDNLIKGLGELSHQTQLVNVNAIKSEALRRCKPCHDVFDASDWCQFPITAISTPHGEASGDHIVKRVFDDAVEQYAGKYTIGVVESCLSKKKYQETLANYNDEQALAKYSVEAITHTPTAIHIPILVDQIVFVKELDDNAAKKVYSISSRTLTLKLAKKPYIPVNSTLAVTFDRFAGDSGKATHTYIVQEYKSVRQHRQYFTLMRLHVADTHDVAWLKQLDRFMTENIDSFPAEPQFEVKRTTYGLSRDLISLNSPWLAFLCRNDTGNITPVACHCTSANDSTLQALVSADGLGINQRAWSLAIHESQHRPTYIIRYVDYTSAGSEIHVSTTLKQALDLGTLQTMIARGKKNGSLRIMKVVSRTLEPSATKGYLDDEGLNPKHRKIVSEASHLVYVLNVTSAAVGDKVNYVDNGNEISPIVVRSGPEFPVEQIRHRAVERRRAPRYALRLNCSIAVDFLTRIDGTVLDISTRGMRIHLSQPTQLRSGDNVRVKLPELGLYYRKLAVVHNNRENGCLQLKYPRPQIKKMEAAFASLRQKMGLKLKDQNEHVSQAILFDILLRLAGDYSPTIQVLLRDDELPELTPVLAVRCPHTDLDAHLLPQSNEKLSLARLVLTKNDQSSLLAKRVLGEIDQVSVGSVVLDTGKTLVLPADLEGQTSTFALVNTKHKNRFTDCKQVTIIFSGVESLSPSQIKGRIEHLAKVSPDAASDLLDECKQFVSVMTIVDTGPFLRILFPKMHTH